MSTVHRPLTALVTGGTGAIGPVLVQRLVAAGYRVKVLVRYQPVVGLLPDDVVLILGDINDYDLLRTVMRDVDMVFHLAAKLHITDPGPELISEYERVNVTGTLCLVEAALMARVKRFIFFSTIAVYGATDPGMIVDEKSRLFLETVYARTKQQAEQIVLSAQQLDDGQPLAVVLRLAAVYGRRVKGNYARLVSALQRGWFVPIGTGNNCRTLVHEQDVATAALLAAEHPIAAGQIYNITDGQIHTFQEILAAICQGLGRQPPRWQLPVRPLRWGIGFIEQAALRLGKSPPVNRATIDKLLEEVAVSGLKFEDEVGFRPQFDLKTGWRNVCVALEQR